MLVYSVSYSETCRRTHGMLPTGTTILRNADLQFGIYGIIWIELGFVVSHANHALLSRGTGMRDAHAFDLAVSVSLC